MIKDLAAVVFAAWLMGVPAAIAGPNSSDVFLPAYAFGVGLLAIGCGVIAVIAMRGSPDRRMQGFKAAAVGATFTLAAMLLN